MKFAKLNEIIANEFFLQFKCKTHCWCTEFQRKVFAILESNAYELRRLSKEILLMKHLQQKQLPVQQGATEAPGCAVIEVIVLIFTCLVWFYHGSHAFWTVLGSSGICIPFLRGLESCGNLLSGSWRVLEFALVQI